MELLEKEMDLELLQLDNYIRTQSDMMIIEMTHQWMYNEYEGVYTEKSNTSFINKIGEIFKKIIKTIHDIIDKIILAAQTKIQQIAVNQKLMDLKITLAQRKDLYNDMSMSIGNTDIVYKSINEYFLDYTKYINDLVKGYKKIYHMKLDKPGDYRKEATKLEKELSEKYSDLLTCKEKQILNKNVMATIQMTERETKNYKKSIEKIKKVNDRALTQLQKMSMDCLNEVMESAGNSSEAINMEASRVMQYGAQNVTKTTKKVAKTIAFHPIEVLLLFSSKFDLYYNDKKYRKFKKNIDKGINKELERREKISNENREIANRVYKQNTGVDLYD